MDSHDVQSDLKHVLYTKEQIQSRIEELAADIDRDYAGRDVLLVGVLKGAVMVMADLSRALHSHITMDWMAVSSYGSGTQSSAKVEIDVKYVGYEIPNEFVVGYGLDFAEKYRNLDFIGTLAPHVYE